MPVPFNTLKNVVVMALCAGLSMTSMSIMITIGGLVGYALADDKALATLPVSTLMVGTMAATIPASFWMRRVGRRAGFMSGVVIGICGAAISSLALYLSHFWLFCLGTMLIGSFNAFSQYYRFAAAEVSTADFRSRAISLVMVGGLIAAFLGPASTRWTKDLLDPLTFLGSYLSIILICLVVMSLLTLIDIPKMTAEQRCETGRPLGQIMAQPVFIVAAMSAMIGYGVMSLVMTATPLAMVAHNHPFDDATVVIQWHIFGMYAPSFFTGHLIRYFGVLRVILAGAFVLLAALSMGIYDVELLNFWTGLALLGVGWNFLFVGGTTLLTECYTEAEKAKAQAANDFLVFGTMMLASFASGSLLHLFGWQIVNYGALPFVALSILATLWLALRRRREARQAA